MPHQPKLGKAVGRVIGQGTNKLVYSTFDNQQTVQVILPRFEYEKEVGDMNMLRASMPGLVDDVLFGLSDNLPVSKFECKAMMLRRGRRDVDYSFLADTSYVMVTNRRVSSFASKGTSKVHSAVHIMDVVHCLYQLAKRGFAHGDVKHSNIVVDPNNPNNPTNPTKRAKLDGPVGPSISLAKLTDFGYTIRFSDIHCESLTKPINLTDPTDPTNPTSVLGMTDSPKQPHLGQSSLPDLADMADMADLADPPNQPSSPDAADQTSQFSLPDLPDQANIAGSVGWVSFDDLVGLADTSFQKIAAMCDNFANQDYDYAFWPVLIRRLVELAPGQADKECLEAIDKHGLAVTVMHGKLGLPKCSWHDFKDLAAPDRAVLVTDKHSRICPTMRQIDQFANKPFHDWPTIYANLVKRFGIQHLVPSQLDDDYLAARKANQPAQPVWPSQAKSGKSAKTTKTATSGKPGKPAKRGNSLI
jgi:serine/threonine protein kinase